MIAGIFHQGSGLGNQLHRYVATRVRAADLGVKFGMFYLNDGSGKESGFKGNSFMPHIYPTWLSPLPEKWRRWQEKKIVDQDGIDIRSFDPEFDFIEGSDEDPVIIDGEFQDERYWAHHESELDDWLKVERLDVPHDLCVIGFRGGEFAVYPDLFLTKEYWDQGIKKMRDINPLMKFEVHTDDPVLAQQFFPQFRVIHDIGLNWRSTRYATYAIVANSSFFILPRWMSKGMTIAPRYWGRRNTKVWSLPQNYYSRFLYI